MDEIAILLDEPGLEEKIKNQGGKKFGGAELDGKDLGHFASALSRLLEGGIPLLRALEAMEASLSSQCLKDFLHRLGGELRQGRGLSAAFERMPNGIPPYFMHMAHAGEVSGTLPAVLRELAGHLEEEEALRRRIIEALAYPGFILCTGAITLGVLLTVVIPKLAVVYGDIGSELPFMTRIVLDAGRLFLPALLGLGACLAIGIMIFRKRRKSMAPFFRGTPVFGKLIRNLALARFASLVSLLSKSGIPVLSALEITGRTFSDPTLKRDISLIRSRLSEGEGVSMSFEGIEWVDGLSRMLVASGEESGRLPAAFSEVARDTEARIGAEIRLMVKLLEPALILGVGLVVGLVVIATVLPIFDVSGLVR